MRNNLLVFLALFVVTISCQSQKMTQLESVELEVAKKLFLSKDLGESEYVKFKKTGKGISIYGIHNSVSSDKMKEGVYGISKGTHSLVYFLIYEESEMQILNISSAESFALSTKYFLEFAERKKYCVEIIKDYMTRFINVYYKINKNLNTRKDINCSKGINSTDDLP